MELVKLDEKNYLQLREWRNKNTKYFLQQDYVTEEQHEFWFRKTIKNKDKHFFVINEGGRDVGTICFDFSNNEMHNVLIADPKDRRKGYMEKAINLLIKNLGLKDIDIKINVLKNNREAGIFYQEVMGFQYAGEDRVEYIFTKHV